MLWKVFPGKDGPVVESVPWTRPDKRDQRHVSQQTANKARKTKNLHLNDFFECRNEEMKPWNEMRNAERNILSAYSLNMITKATLSLFVTTCHILRRESIVFSVLLLIFILNLFICSLVANFLNRCSKGGLFYCTDMENVIVEPFAILVTKKLSLR